MWPKKNVLTVHTPHSPHGLTVAAARARFARLFCTPVGRNDSGLRTWNKSSNGVLTSLSQKRRRAGLLLRRLTLGAQSERHVRDRNGAFAQVQSRLVTTRATAMIPRLSQPRDCDPQGCSTSPVSVPIRSRLGLSGPCHLGERRSPAEEAHAPFAFPLSRSHWQATNHRVSDAWNSTRWQPLLGDAPPEDVRAVRLRMEFRLLWCRDAL